MANLLNVFKTVAAELTTTSTTLYTAPLGYTAIILMAQISNVTSTTKQVTFSHLAGVTTTELLNNFSIPGYDAVSATTGKLVLETGQSVKAFSSANSSLKIVLSILESSNG